ncbi:hypothetical protein KIN20_017726 [Parelaphostrongylus tenuis]|uniref:Uncharacterized protein n=1 Tax=Parelaphostrongylus tenuis TaxID=148309 RepID=A0AAD5QQZ4_PARTN|nr:hypothetical protein KIN20_017726 [Parelaphostrongylus tenuis]
MSFGTTNSNNDNHINNYNSSWCTRSTPIMSMKEVDGDSFKAAETFRQINETWGDGIVGKSAVFDRFCELNAGNGDCIYKRSSINRKAII